MLQRFLEPYIDAALDAIENALKPLTDALRRRREDKELKPFRRHFQTDILPQPVDGLAEYPPKEYLGEKNIFAYIVIFLIDPPFETAIADLAAVTFPVQLEKEGAGRWAENERGETLWAQWYPEFNGIKYRIVTNSVGFLTALDALETRPPHPWDTWPGLDAFDVRPTQGGPEWWWYAYWKPYWLALPQEKVDVYLEEQLRNHPDWLSAIAMWGGRID